MGQLKQKRAKNQGRDSAGMRVGFLKNISRVKWIKMLMRSTTFFGFIFSALDRGMLEKLADQLPEVEGGVNK